MICGVLSLSLSTSSLVQDGAKEKLEEGEKTHLRVFFVFVTCRYTSSQRNFTKPRKILRSAYP